MMKETNKLILPAYKSDGMIVQQNEPIVIKGKDLPGTSVIVTFDNETIDTHTDKNGW